MKDTRFTDDQVNTCMDLVKAGVNRFFLDGSPVWGKKEFSKLFSIDIILEDDRVKSELDSWERKGNILFLGLPDTYIRVIRQFD